jgi:L-2,4-diaminobutyric acid acetyltransferase
LFHPESHSSFAGSDAAPKGFDGGLTVRPTTAADGALLRELVRSTRLLEPITGYGYVLLADLFGQTSAIAEQGGRCVGGVVGLRHPRQPHALFVWQVGVHPSAQRRGVAHAMLGAIFARPGNADLHQLLATVAPTNTASEAMFRGFAERHGAQLEWIGGYAADLFPDPHEPERMFCISGLSAARPDAITAP